MTQTSADERIESAIALREAMRYLRRQAEQNGFTEAAHLLSCAAISVEDQLKGQESSPVPA